MNRGLKVAVAIILVGSLGFPAYAGYELWTTNSKVSEAEEETKSARSDSQGWIETESVAQKQLQDAKDQAKALSSAAKARLSFDSSLEAVKEQLQLASGKVSIEDAQNRILAAQKLVLEKSSDSKLIEAQTAELDAVTTELKDSIGAVDRRAAEAKAAESKPKPAPATVGSNSTPNSSVPAAASAPTDWLADMRSRLNAVGGSSVNLEEFDGNCDGVISVACSWGVGTIKVAPSIASWSSSKKNTVMAHELAHQYQYQVMEQIEASPSYQSLFGGNIELLANCMASARGYTAHGMSCTQPRIDWARSIWSGVVPS